MRHFSDFGCFIVSYSLANSLSFHTQSLVGTLISVSPAVWQSPLHYQAFQQTLLESLRRGRNASRTILLNHKCKFLYSEEGRNSFLDTVHRKPQALEGGQSKEDHGEATILARFGRECSGRLPEQVSVRELGLQTAPLGVSEGVPQAAGRSYSGCFRITEMSPGAQIHVLGRGGQGDSSERFGVAVGPGNLAIPPGASHSGSSSDSGGAADRSSSYIIELSDLTSFFFWHN